jgi:hypothetical protein
VRLSSQNRNDTHGHISHSYILCRQDVGGCTNIHVGKMVMKM